MIDRIPELADRVGERLEGEPPHVVGVAGPVAVGKSTIAAALVEALTTARGWRAHVLATDCFLFPNEHLAERDLLWRKGFPETYDVDTVLTCIERVRRGDAEVTVPVYSHQSYDIVPGETAPVPPVDVLVLEGVAVLQPPVCDRLDVAVYVDAAEHDVVAWYIERFLGMWTDAAGDPRSFYARFDGFSAAQVADVARQAWAQINGPNLAQHIRPSRQHADLIVEKAADHSIVRIVSQS